tara:strand:+ start:6173 stop:6439 length:267 start_codon:yes stop_codon:yes gene_type:complete
MKRSAPNYVDTFYLEIEVLMSYLLGADVSKSNTNVFLAHGGVFTLEFINVFFRIKVILFDLGFEQSLVTKKQASAFVGLKSLWWQTKM